MMESAVQFPTERRIHIGLTVASLSRVMPFYRELFGQAPSKTKPGYVKFEVEEPPINFTLNERSDYEPRFGSCDHFGIQVKDRASIAKLSARMAAAGWETRAEEGVVCCYAEQDKVWATDPEGRMWEVFVVLDAEKEEHGRAPHESAAATAEELLASVEASEDDACCAPTCCT
ncbi:MAG: ArsI/CadI family heavy metal resistance metalloenzyme [Myxococcota bacterium]